MKKLEMPTETPNPPPSRGGGRGFLAGTGCLLLIVALVGSFGYLGWVLTGEWRQARTAAASSRAAAQEREAGVLAAQDRRDVEVACEEAVRGRLKAPATAVFAKSADAAWDGNAWRYAGTVDAENALGTPLRSSFACAVAGPSWQEAAVQVSVD
ncbi:hypothetical protein [Deinococcus sp. UR1]|uniref:hypothetical protein n=1 Tax=Deinococcus sp. UR1 TaxID=1704277 RepID=UPI000C1775BF|nr:hypothetical protein [Deinococcus sp. UR1]PIH00267.1 hypothetical protein AMD26_001485 [Deinococcus sp. UR1]